MCDGQCGSCGNCGDRYGSEQPGLQAQPVQEAGQWAIVELMGRNIIAGLISEEVRYGATFMRVDVPVTTTQPAYTKYFSAAHSVYAITPTTEALARGAAEKLRVKPVELYILPDAQRDPSSFLSTHQMYRRNELAAHRVYGHDEIDE